MGRRPRQRRGEAALCLYTGRCHRGLPSCYAPRARRVHGILVAARARTLPTGMATAEGRSRPVTGPRGRPAGPGSRPASGPGGRFTSGASGGPAIAGRRGADAAAARAARGPPPVSASLRPVAAAAPEPERRANPNGAGGPPLRAVGSFGAPGLRRGVGGRPDAVRGGQRAGAAVPAARRARQRQGRDDRPRPPPVAAAAPGGRTTASVTSGTLARAVSGHAAEASNG